MGNESNHQESKEMVSRALGSGVGIDVNRQGLAGANRPSPRR